MLIARSHSLATFVFTPCARSLPVPSAKKTTFFDIATSPRATLKPKVTPVVPPGKLLSGARIPCTKVGRRKCEGCALAARRAYSLDLADQGGIGRQARRGPSGGRHGDEALRRARRVAAARLSRRDQVQRHVRGVSARPGELLERAWRAHRLVHPLHQGEEHDVRPR